MATRAGWLRPAALGLGLALAVLDLGCSGQSAPRAAPLEQSARSVLPPARFGWVNSTQPSGDLPSALPLGGKASGRVLVYLEFAVPSTSRRLLGAALLLATSGPPGIAVEVEVSRTDAPSGELRSWADQPHARYPRLTARLESDSALLRLDVSELLRAESKPGEPLRLLLRAEPNAAEPVLLQTGAAGGAAPRLEAYWE